MKLSITYNASTEPNQELPRTVTVEDNANDYTINEVLREFVIPVLIGMGFHPELVKEYVQVSE